MTKRRIEIAFADPGDAPVFNGILEFVRDRYDISITDSRDADFVMHSTGFNVLQYSGVRIFATGENVSPNFNISDYSISFDKLQFADRHLWLPLIKLYRNAYHALTQPRPPIDEVIAGKSGFCSYVMSNTSNSADERTRIFDLLSQYKHVDSGGSWNNNVGGRVPDKIAFQSNYKFVIAFENSSRAGYLTEKFADAAASNAIPIYWGDPEIGQLLNPKAFINCHDFDSLEAVVEKVRAIDTDDALYRNMLSEPWFRGGQEPEALQDAGIIRFLSHIFDQEPSKAMRRNTSRWGLKTERQLYTMYYKPHLQAFRLAREGWRALRGKQR